MDYDDDEESESVDDLQAMQRNDPLFADKQYLVTKIYNNFIERGLPTPTTHEFYRIGKKIGQGAFGRVHLA